MSAVKHVFGYVLVQVEKGEVLNHAVVCVYFAVVMAIVAAGLSYRRR